MSKNFVADRMNSLAPSGIRKVNEKALELERQGESVLHFEIGRPDFDTPEYIKAACIDSINRGDVFYTSNFGDMALRKTIAEKLNHDSGCQYEAANILVTVGLSEGVFDVLCTILNEGDEVLIPDPSWINYLNVPKLLGAVPVSYTLKEENGYQLDLEEIRQKITPKCKAIVITTPHNPTGSVLALETLEELAKIAQEEDIYVISDEIYERLIYDGEKHFSIASLPNMLERTFTMNGFSKAYSMTGWRIGYIAGPADMILTVNKLHQQNTTCAPSFVQKAALVALTDEGSEVADMVEEYKKRRDYAVAALNEIEGVSCICPKGAFYIFMNVKEIGKSADELCAYLLDTAKVALVPGTVFGENGEGYIRMSYASSYENIIEGCARIKTALDALA